MINVCYMIDSPYAGGAERYISLIFDAIDRDLFSPSLIAATEPGLDRWCADAVDRGVPVSRVPMNLPFRPHHTGPIIKALWHHSPHIVHVNMPGPYNGQTGLLAPLARWAGARSVVVTEHLPMVERLWKRALVKGVAYRSVDMVLTVSLANIRYLTELQRVPEEKIRVIYNGIPRTFGADRGGWRGRVRAQMGIDGETVALAMVGSLIERKGVGVLLEAVAGFEGPPWCLFLIGGGAQQSDYVEMVERRGLGARVRFVGERSADEVEELLCAMDALVVPSFMEGMPYVILEAMGCGLPVVASRIHGVPEAAIDGETARLVPPGDTAALRSALGEIVGDSALRERMGRRGRDRFERLFSLDRHIARMQSTYLELLHGPR